MKHALVNGQLIQATPNAPSTAICPHCGGVVTLRVRQGTWFWRHEQRPRGGCPPLQMESGTRRR
jgi:hypothetical protein